MVANLVATVGDLQQRLGVEFGVDSLYKEGGLKPELVEHAQDPGSICLTEKWRPRDSLAGHSPRSRSAASPRLSKVMLTAARWASGPQVSEGTLGGLLMCLSS